MASRTPRSPEASSALKRELDTLSSDNPLTEKLIKYGPRILGGLALLFALALLLYRLAAGGESAAESDFVGADNDFRTVKRELLAGEKGDATVATGALDRLEALIKRHPTLATKYDGPLAQILFSSNMGERALPFAQRLLTRSRSTPAIAAFTTFGGATVDIAQHKTESAIASSQKLREELVKNSEGEFDLEIFNILRLAALNPTGATWQTIKDNLSNTSGEEKGKGYRELAGLFQDGDVSLIEYLDYAMKNPQT